MSVTLPNFDTHSSNGRFTKETYEFPAFDNTIKRHFSYEITSTMAKSKSSLF